jgi:hypothetical protein
MTNPAETPTAAAPLTRIPFSPRAESSIRALATWMRIAGVITIVGAILKVLVLILVRNDLGQVIASFVTFLMGVWTLQASTAFNAVATTDVADQRKLMEGVSLLRRVFLLQATLVLLGLAILLVALIGVAIFVMAH